MFSYICSINNNKTNNIMNTVVANLTGGINYFGSGSSNSEEFNEFFKTFKKSFTYQLKKLNATEISFSKGHFYLSGFFKVDNQYYYFSLSDVRSNYGAPEDLLIRTADSPKDYTGGSNNYVRIENGMHKTIARTFNLKIDKTKSTSSKKGKTSEDYAKQAIEQGYLRLKAGSSRKANRICWAVSDVLGLDNHSISIYKHGRYISKCTFNCDKFNYYYDGDTKTLSIQMLEISDEDFIDSLDVTVGSYVRNPYSGQSAHLNPLQYALYNYIKEAETNGNKLFTKALNIFRSRWADEYYTLLD